MQSDDIRDRRIQAENDLKEARTFDKYIDASRTLATWVIAEQLYEVSHHLAAFREVIDPGAGERFPGYVRVRIHEEENT